MTLEEWAERLETPEQKALRRRLRWQQPLMVALEAIGFAVALALLTAVVYVFAAAFS